MPIDLTTLRQQVADRLPDVADLVITVKDDCVYWQANTPNGVHYDFVPLSDADSLAEALYLSIGPYALPDAPKLPKPSPDLRLLTQRVASRLPDVRGLVLTPTEPGPLSPKPGVAYTFTHEGVPYSGRCLIREGADHIVDRIAAKLLDSGVTCRLLPEVVLQDTTVIVMNGFEFRIAESLQVVRSEARVGDRTYDAADAERDLRLVMEALAEETRDDGGPWPDHEAKVQGCRADALALLNVLRLTAFGAPQSSAGGRWLAAQHEAAQRTGSAEGYGNAPRVAGEALQGPGTENLAPTDAETPGASPSVLRAAEWFRSQGGEYGRALHLPDGLSLPVPPPEAPSVVGAPDASASDLAAWCRAEQWADSIVAPVYVLIDAEQYDEARAVVDALIAEHDSGPLRRQADRLESLIRASIPSVVDAPTPNWFTGVTVGPNANGIPTLTGPEHILAQYRACCAIGKHLTTAGSGDVERCCSCHAVRREGEHWRDPEPHEGVILTHDKMSISVDRPPLGEVTVTAGECRVSPWTNGYRFLDPRPDGCAFADHWLGRVGAPEDDGTTSWETQWASGPADTVAEAMAEVDADLVARGVALGGTLPEGDVETRYAQPVAEFLAFIGDGGPKAAPVVEAPAKVATWTVGTGEWVYHLPEPKAAEAPERKPLTSAEVVAWGDLPGVADAVRVPGGEKTWQRVGGPAPRQEEPLQPHTPLEFVKTKGDYKPDFAVRPDGMPMEEWLAGMQTPKTAEAHDGLGTPWDHIIALTGGNSGGDGGTAEATIVTPHGTFVSGSGGDGNTEGGGA